MQIGLTQCTSGSSGTGLLERVAELGLHGAEPMVSPADCEYLRWSADQVREFVARGEALGVSVPTVGMAVFTGDDALIRPEEHDRAVDVIVRSLRFAAAVGADAMMLCNFCASSPDTPAKREHTLDVLRRVEPTARKLELTIALESPLPAEELAGMVDAVGSEHMGVYYDVGNALYLGYDPAAEIDLLGSRIVGMHVKDTDTDLGDSHLGEGRVDLGAAVAAMRRVGYDGWLMLETSHQDGDAAVREDIRTLRELLETRTPG